MVRLKHTWLSLLSIWQNLSMLKGEFASICRQLTFKISNRERIMFLHNRDGVARYTYTRIYILPELFLGLIGYCQVWRHRLRDQ